MKAKSLILVACATMTMILSSCGLKGLVGSITEVSKEAEDITAGKVFKVKNGAVYYTDGVIIRFEDYGKIQYREESNVIMIYDGTKMYNIDLNEAKYTETEEADMYPALFSDLVVMEATYEFGDKLDKYSTGYKMTKGTMTIDEKSCKKYTITDGEDTEVIGSWNRVMVYSETNGKVALKATTIAASTSDIMGTLDRFDKANN